MVSTRVRTVIAGLALGPMMLLAPSTPAWGEDQAVILLSGGVERATTDCPSDYVCMYRDSNLGGGGYGVRDGFDLNDFRGIDFNDQLSSWVNYTDDRYCWYSDLNFTGSVQSLDAGDVATSLSPQHNDTASALAYC